VLELGRLDALLSKARNSLTALVDGLAGRDTGASERDDVDNLHTAIFEGRVPKAWSMLAYPSNRALSSWVMDLRERAHWLWGWADRVHPPANFWISRMFHPRAFLTSILQGFARDTGLKLDAVTFVHKVVSEASSSHVDVNRGEVGGKLNSQHATSRVADDKRGSGHKPIEAEQSGARIMGMFLEGASCWDAEGQHLVDASPRAKHFSMMPAVIFSPTPALEIETSQESFKTGLGYADDWADFTSANGCYLCPLYRTAKRCGGLSTTGPLAPLVCTVNLPSSVDSNHWVLRGVALVCEPTDASEQHSLHARAPS